MFRSTLRTKPQSKIFKQSIQQLGRELGNFFPDKESIPAYLSKATDDISDISKLKNNDKFGIPLFAYRVDSMSPNRERFNRSTLRRHGIVINNIEVTEESERPEDPNRFYHTLHLTPTDVTFDVIYYCSYNELYDFGPMWQQAAQEHYLNFDVIAGDNYKIPIKIEMSEDVTFSDINYDEKLYCQFATSVVMSTYHGVVSEVRPIEAYRVNTGIIVEKNEAKGTLVPSLEITRDKDTTVFVKNRLEGD